MQRYAKKFLRNISSASKNFPPTSLTTRTASTAACRKRSKISRAIRKYRKRCAKVSRPLCNASHLPDYLEELIVALVFVFKHPKRRKGGQEEDGSAPRTFHRIVHCPLQITSLCV